MGGQDRQNPYENDRAGRGMPVPGRTPARHVEYPASNGQGGRSGYPVETSDYSAAATGVNIKKKASGRGGGGGAGGGAGGGRGNYANVSQDENAPVCVCGGRALTKTVTKEGPTKGRPFYTCPKPM